MCVGQPTEILAGCMQEFGAGVDSQALNNCYNSPRVQELMIMNDLETMKAKPQWVPWFQLDSKNLVDVPTTGGKCKRTRDFFWPCDALFRECRGLAASSSQDAFCQPA